MSIADLVTITSNPKFLTRCEKLASQFDFKFMSFVSPDNYFESDVAAQDVKCFVLDSTVIANVHEAAGAVQVARQMMDRSYIITIISSRLTPDEMALIKKSGASLILLEDEFVTNSKLEFVTTQIIKASYIPVKQVDFVMGSTVPCDIFHLMPVNKRFLKILKSGGVFRKDIFEKYQEVGDFYVHRHDVSAWQFYCENAPLDTEESYMRLCRSQFNSLQQNFIDLVLMISDQTTSSSFQDGKKLFDECTNFAKKLIDNLTHVREPWSVISGAAVGDFGSVERGTAVAAYAGLLSKKSGVGDPLEVMIGALFADVGYLALSPSTTMKLRTGDPAAMHAEERAEFEKHPIYSLNQCLSKRLPFTENVKNMITMSHERLDMKGFPSRPGAIKITEAAQLVRLSYELDQALTVRMGEERLPLEILFKNFIDHKIASQDGYSLAFLFELKPYFNLGPALAH